MSSLTTIKSRYNALFNSLNSQGLIGPGLTVLCLSLKADIPTAYPEYNPSATLANQLIVENTISTWDWTEQLAEAQAAAIAAVHAKTCALMESGVSVTLKGTTYVIGGMSYYAMNYQAICESLSGGSNSIRLILSDGNILALDNAADIKNVFAAFNTRRDALSDNAVAPLGALQLVAEINAATTVAQVQAVEDQRV